MARVWSCFPDKTSKGNMVAMQKTCDAQHKVLVQRLRKKVDLLVSVVRVQDRYISPA